MVVGLVGCLRTGQHYTTLKYNQCKECNKQCHYAGDGDDDDDDDDDDTNAEELYHLMN